MCAGSRAELSTYKLCGMQASLSWTSARLLPASALHMSHPLPPYTRMHEVLLKCPEHHYSAPYPQANPPALSWTLHVVAAAPASPGAPAQPQGNQCLRQQQHIACVSTPDLSSECWVGALSGPAGVLEPPQHLTFVVPGVKQQRHAVLVHNRDTIPVPVGPSVMREQCTRNSEPEPRTVARGVGFSFASDSSCCCCCKCKPKFIPVWVVCVKLCLHLLSFLLTHTTTTSTDHFVR